MPATLRTADHHGIASQLPRFSHAQGTLIPRNAAAL
jgi:hypothetical protein